MKAYYNEIDPKAAAWLRELIKRGLIAAGDVDERSIKEVTANDVRGYTQCHFFAGIGGWSHALRLAGWRDDRHVWTGSCPCQPFSSAGNQLAESDPRHLWPDFARLIGECRPTACFGEQVASKLGRQWLAGVRADLEGMGYAVGAADLCAAGVGAPHIRQRLWWVASSLGHPGGDLGGGGRDEPKRVKKGGASDRGLGSGDVVYAGGGGCKSGGRAEAKRVPNESGYWSIFDTVSCADGKTRRIESGSSPLAHGVPARVVRLRGYGNAIVPQVAAEFIRATEGVTP